MSVKGRTALFLTGFLQRVKYTGTQPQQRDLFVAAANPLQKSTLLLISSKNEHAFNDRFFRISDSEF